MSDESANAPIDTPAPAEAAAPAPAEAAAPAEAPTLRDHAEGAQLRPWQLAAIVRRLHGAREEGAAEVTANTRMNAQAFEQAAAVALHGRI
jgi:hypothetical protein